MATKQQARPKRSPSKRPTARRSPATRAPAKRSSAKKRSPWLGDALRQTFAGHGHDVAGVLLIVVGVVAGLGIYANGAGPAGHAVATGFGAAVGLAAWVLPPALVGLGVVVIRGRRPEAEPAAIVGPVVGGLFVLVGVCALADLARGRPRWGAPVERFVRAGGALGTVTGGSLAPVVGVAAAAVVAVAVVLIGVLLLTRTSMRAVAGQTAAGVKPLTGALGRALRPLFEVGSADRAEAAERSAEIDLRDGDPALPPESTEPQPPAVEPDPVVEVAGEPVPTGPDPFADGEPESDDGPTDGPGGPAQQLEIALGPASKGPVWKLPRSSCSTARPSRRWTAKRWSSGAGPSRPPWPRTASRPAWWA